MMGLKEVNNRKIKRRWKLIDTIEKITGKTVEAKAKEVIVRGADEIDLVRSGLEDTMIAATNELFAGFRNQNREIKELRTAAFVNGFDKLAVSYLQLGVFP